MKLSKYDLQQVLHSLEKLEASGVITNSFQTSGGISCTVEYRAPVNQRDVAQYFVTSIRSRGEISEPGR